MANDPTRTRVALAGDFARDAAHAYWQDEVIHGVAADDFAVLPAPPGEAPCLARDRGRVLFFHAGLVERRFDDAGNALGIAPIVIEGADPNAFEDLGAHYGRDDRRAYYQGHRLLEVDADDVRACRHGMLVTAHAVYFEGAPVALADAASFEILSSEYARDRAHAYYAVQDDYPSLVALAGAAPAQLEILGGGYARAGDRGYYRAWPCFESGAASMRVLGDDFAATDGAVVYRSQAIAGADPASFTVQPALRDRHRGYRLALRDVDPDRFEVVADDA